MPRPSSSVQTTQGMALTHAAAPTHVTQTLHALHPPTRTPDTQQQPKKLRENPAGQECVCVPQAPIPTLQTPPLVTLHSIHPSIYPLSDQRDTSGTLTHHVTLLSLPAALRTTPSTTRSHKRGVCSAVPSSYARQRTQRS
mmetsp:Transcript_49651/g.124542  ORF Transcript_49651/g.124542 Transcript_49651/m.124542 type:complete len:140 (+) Transcript_49651:1350-1769(+)